MTVFTERLDVGMRDGGGGWAGTGPAHRGAAQRVSLSGWAVAVTTTPSPSLLPAPTKPKMSSQNRRAGKAVGGNTVTPCARSPPRNLPQTPCPHEACRRPRPRPGGGGGVVGELRGRAEAPLPRPPLLATPLSLSVPCLSLSHHFHGKGRQQPQGGMKFPSISK